MERSDSCFFDLVIFSCVLWDRLYSFIAICNILVLCELIEDPQEHKVVSYDFLVKLVHNYTEKAKITLHVFEALRTMSSSTGDSHIVQ
jgi:hypothetical protein